MTVGNADDPISSRVVKPDNDRDTMIKFLTKNEQICFKSQQKWEADLTEDEKFQIGLDLFCESKLRFLIKFGNYLQKSQLQYFQMLTHAEPEQEEIKVLINDLSKKITETHSTTVKNRRYQAMVQMIEENSYFSEIEMMKRNPLLYNQLVGQYLTSDEVEERDRYVDSEMGLVKILMEGIERDAAEEVRKKEEDIENKQTEETLGKVTVWHNKFTLNTSHWGEIGEKSIQKEAFLNKGKKKATRITPEEQKLLKEEFITTMYNSFLDGKDEDFDYENIDNDTRLDNIEEMDNDAEEKYFDSDDLDENNVNVIESESSEDELDIFMRNLN